MWKEPMVVIGLVVIAASVVCGVVAVFAREVALSISTVLFAFVGAALLQMKALADAKAAVAAAKTAVTVAENTREEQVQGREKVQEAVQQLTETVAATKAEVADAAASGVRQGLEQARGKA